MLRDYFREMMRDGESHDIDGRHASVRGPSRWPLTLQPGERERPATRWHRRHPQKGNQSLLIGRLRSRISARRTSRPRASSRHAADATSRHAAVPRASRLGGRGGASEHGPGRTHGTLQRQTVRSRDEDVHMQWRRWPILRQLVHHKSLRRRRDVRPLRYDFVVLPSGLSGTQTRIVRVGIWGRAWPLLFCRRDQTNHPSGRGRPRREHLHGPLCANRPVTRPTFRSFSCLKFTRLTRPQSGDARGLVPHVRASDGR